MTVLLVGAAAAPGRVREEPAHAVEARRVGDAGASGFHRADGRVIGDQRPDPAIGIQRARRHAAIVIEDGQGGAGRHLGAPQHPLEPRQAQDAEDDLPHLAPLDDRCREEQDAVPDARLARDVANHETAIGADAVEPLVAALRQERRVLGR